MTVVAYTTVAAFLGATRVHFTSAERWLSSHFDDEERCEDVSWHDDVFHGCVHPAGHEDVGVPHVFCHPDWLAVREEARRLRLQGR